MVDREASRATDRTRARSADGPELSRRAFVLGAGGALGWLATRGLPGAGPLGEIPPAGPERTQAILRELVASLSPFQREQLLFPSDHPSRTVVNTISFLPRPQLAIALSPVQQRLALALLPDMLSERGLEDMAATFALEGDPRSAVLSIYGDPHREPAEAVLAGGHFTLRSGSAGGPVAYGQQIGNGRWQVEGNAFKHHGDAANALIATLSPSERSKALLARAPDEFELQPEARLDAIPGVAYRALGEDAKEAFATLFEKVRATFGESPALGAVELETLHFSAFHDHAYLEGKRPARDLSDSAPARDAYYQVWRIEGPTSVIHFLGDPHVHGYFHVPGATSTSTLAHLSTRIEGDDMRTLHEAALRRASGEKLAYQRSREFGRLCPGAVTAGLLWSTEPYRSDVVVATIDREAMADPLRSRLRAQGVDIDSSRAPLRIATTEQTAMLAHDFGEPDRIERVGVELRDVLVDLVSSDGLRALRAT